MQTQDSMPTPGRALVMATGFVSAITEGPKEGGLWCGVPLAVSSTATQFRRRDGFVMRLPNESVAPVSSVWAGEAMRRGINPFTAPGWGWLSWSVAEHAAADSEADNTPLVLISCGARKQGERSRADELYNGTYFRLTLQAARRMVPDDRIRIISALHGIVPLHSRMNPYNVRLGDPDAISATEFCKQARVMHLDTCNDVTVLAGKDYAQLARQVWPHADAPLLGSRGIGDQQRILANMAR